MGERILVVDDDVRNLQLIELYLEDEGYEILTAQEAETGWQILQQQHEHIDLLLLDRMMPELDGIDFLKRYRATALQPQVPVIMQTAASEPAQIREGLEQGIFYYLIKPYDEEVLISLVRGAIADARRRRELYEAMGERERTLALVTEMRLELETLAQAREVAATLAHFYPNPQRVVTGISELLINAVEHGNLGISYTDKSSLLRKGEWQREVERREAHPDYAGRRVQVHLKREADRLILEIEDEGDGFDWQKYIELDKERASDPHGRGIAMARMLSFDRVDYLGSGNRVQCEVNLPTAAIS